MTHGPIDARERRSSTQARWPGRPVALTILTATFGLACAGCATTPGSIDPGKTAPPPVSQEAGNAPRADQARVADPKSEFHAKATDRQQFQVHIDFGRAFEAQGNLDAAVLEYQDALTVLQTKRKGPFRPSDEALAHRRMGSAMDRLGRFAQAETHYKRALKLSPKDPKVWNDVGYSYYLQGRWSDAERALKTAVRFAPDDDRIRTNLGLTLAAEGRTDEALPLLSQSNGDAIGHANLGYLLAATGQHDLARSQYETALALRPDLEVARRALARIDLKQPEPSIAGQRPALIAHDPKSAAHPVDPQVTQTTATRTNIPPPMPSLPQRILPDGRAALMANRPVSPAAAPTVDIVPPPLPPLP
jgi:Flp pilus assembly protein TadD